MLPIDFKVLDNLKKDFFNSNESKLNLDVALIFRIAQTANKSALSTLSASESSRTLRPFISI